MLNLSNITLLAIDTIDPLRTIKAMRYSLLQASFRDAVLVTDNEKYRPEMIRTVGGHGRIDQITVRFVQPGPRSEYERQIVDSLPTWFTTEFCLFQEWDSAIMNPRAWNSEWLKYDFIGAPWPHEFDEPGYPRCTAENCVGNGGFSLRSMEFCFQTARCFRDMGRPKEASRLSDAWISRTARPQLEAAGIKFAPEDEALRFSCENRFYNGQFGIHGKNTIAMNGLDWNFDWLR